MERGLLDHILGVVITLNDRHLLVKRSHIPKTCILEEVPSECISRVRVGKISC